MLSFFALHYNKGQCIMVWLFVCKTLAYKYIIKHARFCQKRWAKKHASTDLLHTQNMQHLHKDHWLPQPSKLHQFCPLMDRQSIFPSISQHKFIDIYTPKSNLYGYCFFSPWMQNHLFQSLSSFWRFKRLLLITTIMRQIYIHQFSFFLRQLEESFFCIFH